MPAAASAATLTEPVTKPVLTALNDNGPAIHQSVSQLFSRFNIDSLNSRSGDIHLVSTLLLIQSFLVNKANRFVLINGHPDNAVPHSCRIERSKPFVFRKTADFSPLNRSRHNPPALLS